MSKQLRYWVFAAGVDAEFDEIELEDAGRRPVFVTNGDEMTEAKLKAHKGYYVLECFSDASHSLVELRAAYGNYVKLCSSVQEALNIITSKLVGEEREEQYRIFCEGD